MLKPHFEALRPRREQTCEIIDHWFAISRSSDSDDMIDVYVCMCVTFLSRIYGDDGGDWFRSLQTKGYCQWKRRVVVENRAESEIRFPIGTAAEEITLQPFYRARRAGYFYFILSRTFGLSTRAYTCHIVALLLLRGEGSACRGRWNKIRWERSERRGTVT